MRKSAIAMPLLALIAGAVGFLLRRTELANIFDELTGLPERGADITIALIAVSVAFLICAFIFALSIRLKFTSPPEFENAFGTDPLAYPLIFFILGLVWIGATIKHLLDLRAAGSIPLSELYFSVLSFLAAISTILFAIEVFQDPRRRSILVLTIVPTIFMCFWLIVLYRRNASNPILLSYCYQCLAIIFSALGFYFTSGFAYNRPAIGKTLFAYFSAIYFCFVTLADGLPSSIKMIFAVLIAINVVYSSMLLRNVQKKAH
jgi:hypothetical protein